MSRKESKGDTIVSGELLEAQQVVIAAIKEHPNDIRGQSIYFFQKFRIPTGKGRSRSVSKLTTTKYVSVMSTFISELQNKGVKVKRIDAFTARHLVLVLRSWEEEGKSASTLATSFSIIKRTLIWFGTDVEQKSVVEVLKDPTNAVRGTSATSSKAWSSVGVKFEDVVARLNTIDPLSALQLEMAAAFGLRVQEACAIKPAESDQGKYLIVHLGAKGGRGRTVEIGTGYQRAVLNKAKEYALTFGNGFLRKRGKSVKSTINTFYYRLRQLGVRKSELGVTAHGLRHEFANQLYASVTGVESAVNNGPKVDIQIDHAARKTVTEALGHSRLAITSAYLGSHKMMDRVTRKHLAANSNALTNRASNLSAVYWSIQSGFDQLDGDLELRVFLVGLTAEGKTPHGSPFLMSAGVFSSKGLRAEVLVEKQQLDDIARAAKDDIGSWVVCNEDTDVPTDIERFELFFLK